MRPIFFSLLGLFLVTQADPLSEASPSSSTISALTPTASAPATTQTSTCSFPPEQSFPQLINHSATSDKSTFSQRVQVNTTFYNPGGPLFIFQGDESSSMACAERFEFASWAPEFGAALMVIEHRYFGKSQPFENDSYTTENLRFLTLDNVMSDTLAVVEWWRTNVTNATGKNSPVIVFGSSYSGSLATFLRINHPETFFGAVTSAGPVRAFFPVTNDPDRFAVLDADAAVKVREGFKELQDMMDAGNSTQIAQTIAVCNPPQKEDRDAFLLLHITGFVFPFDVIANRTLAAPSALAAVNETINAFCFPVIAANGCFDWTLECSDSIGAQATPWDYLRCSYFNFDQGEAGPEMIFASTATYNSTLYCQQTYNITPPTRTELFAKYHFDEDTIRNTTRVIYSQGGVGPVRGLAPDESWFDLAPTDPNAPRYVYADYATHTQDLLSSLGPGNQDPSLLRVRDQEKNIIKGRLTAANLTCF
ncbi:serine carboxypeptidase S28-domain-containing protein [Mycena galopus ATCC 62051]|nr:serine carboxypeptidase S28-domain-containing protein [Mycena galopus ATCC 62051]